MHETSHETGTPVQAAETGESTGKQAEELPNGCVHATCVALNSSGVLLLGAPGAGKSTLALRLLDEPGRGLQEDPVRTRLVADDQVEIRRMGDVLLARAPERLMGLLEVRGVGIMRLPVSRLAEDIPVEAVVRLVSLEEIERLPPVNQSETIMGLPLRCLHLDARDPAAPARLRAWLFGERRA